MFNLFTILSLDSYLNYSHDRTFFFLRMLPLLSYVSNNFQKFIFRTLLLYNFNSFVIIISSGTTKNKSSEFSDFLLWHKWILRMSSAFPSVSSFLQVKYSQLLQIFLICLSTLYSICHPPLHSLQLSCDYYTVLRVLFLF